MGITWVSTNLGVKREVFRGSGGISGASRNSEGTKGCLLFRDESIASIFFGGIAGVLRN